jgi:hypothetical protein
MIDETRSQIPIWLLWVEAASGLVSLGAVTLVQWRARRYRKIILEDPKVVSVRVEPSEANHLYNPLWEDAWQKVYGEKWLEAYHETRAEAKDWEIQRLRHELEKANETIAKAAARIHELEERCR